MKASDNQYPSVVLEEVASDGSATGTPAADHRRLFLGEDGMLHVKDSAGVVTEPYTGASEITDIATSEMDDSLVLAPDGAGGVEFRAEAGGGGGDVRPYIDSGTTLHATYGDDFTGASLDGKWTEGANVGTIAFQQGQSGSWIAWPVANAGGATQNLIYQDAPSGDFSVVASMLISLWNDNEMHCVAILDSSGAGVGCGVYQGELRLFTISGWQYSAMPASLGLTGRGGTPQGTLRRHWLRLTKSGTTYTATYSMDGDIWSPNTADAGTAPSGTWAGTVAKIGVGAIWNNGGTFGVFVDRFNVL